MDDEKMGVGIAETIRSMTDRANAMAAETRLQFDTLVTMQKDERIEIQKMFHDELDKMRTHYGHIIIGLVVTLMILLGGIVGGVAYILTNYEFETYSQEQYIGGDGNNDIHDGIHQGGVD